MNRILTVTLGAFMGAAAGIASPDTMRGVIFCVICAASFILGVIADIMGDGTVMAVHLMQKRMSKHYKDLKAQSEIIEKKKEIDEKILLRLDEIKGKLESPLEMLKVPEENIKFLLELRNIKEKYEEVENAGR